MCDYCGKAVLPPNDQTAATEHINICKNKRRVGAPSDREACKDVECGICFEKIVEKGRKFGILTSCPHAFCLECIREWRGSSQSKETSVSNNTVRSCPHCRVVSYFIIPCDFLVTDQSKKDELIELYKSKLSTISCKYFAKGKGTCKFGNSCMYSHTLEDGTPFVPQVRKMTDSEGSLQWYTGIKLSAFLDDWL
eukprot:TRINITY_DN9263_c0_g1_i1.p1 TRINITY_DN9263_c0_g1~~TRINITY_DN9263_c0_g1_i1.p1  ORF type:complete len:194 (+),score=18.97 TRINITY_DN9263_c0_g1_i1:244-825(+)